jgi:hypothetical protein
VTRHGDFVGWVRGLGGADGGQHARGHLAPGDVEAGVGEAAETQVAGDLEEDEAEMGLEWDGVGVMCSSRCSYSAIQLRTEFDPRKETTICLSTGSTPTKPLVSNKVPLLVTGQTTVRRDQVPGGHT